MPYTYDYPRMLVTVDSVVFLKDKESPLKLLLVKRGNEPYKDAYALPGGFPEMDELLADAAKRELLEETGLNAIDLKQLATFDTIGRDPRGRNIAVVHYGFTSPSNCKLLAGDDAAEAEWFPINELPPLAFDHKEVIEYALAQLGL
ncbi:MAG: NUDIX hydrolase [Tenuifilaceae bacterium]|jgi:8-oxo-dGTP diphosphatase|uniref:NUDIX domain-containing protein n=1 Tax=Perlabentimonas gracilis TaxID=2715279 RepID=UPI00140B769D|nr:NUDIX hydrolase [Perlabentimonas gracilis]MDX9770463.1 NUDIX hydrolase [Tenuifilaceae bacterium]NHB67277.1 NUDIX hydrolase [Perlabentimonas gracilis]